MTTAKCPRCHGFGGAYCLWSGRTSDGKPTGGQRWEVCSFCNGEKRVDADKAAAYEERREAGEALRNDRIARGLNLRQEAARLGITPQELSDREWGREPKP